MKPHQKKKLDGDTESHRKRHGDKGSHWKDRRPADNRSN
jgi:hypothetical protein